MPWPSAARFPASDSCCSALISPGRFCVKNLSKPAPRQVRDVAIYETRPAASLPQHLLEALDAGRVNWITFTSSSTAKNFTALLGEDYISRIKGVNIASIGPITSKTLRDLKLTPTIEAETFNIEGLVNAMHQWTP